jgi:hypothetical protein
MILTCYVTQNIYFDTKKFSALTLGRAVTFHKPPTSTDFKKISYLWTYLAVLTLFSENEPKCYSAYIPFQILFQLPNSQKPILGFS